MSLLLCYEIVYGRLPVQTRWLVDCRYIGGVDKIIVVVVLLTVTLLFRIDYESCLVSTIIYQ